MITSDTCRYNSFVINQSILVKNSNCCSEDEEEKNHQESFYQHHKSNKLKLVVTFIFRFFHIMDHGITVFRLDLTLAESTILSARFVHRFDIIRASTFDKFLNAQGLQALPSILQT